MKVLFIYSVAETNAAGRPLITSEVVQFGISSIAALLRDAGHAIRLVAISRQERDRGRSALLRTCREYAPDAVFYTAVSTQYPFIAETARVIRACVPRAYHLIGGPHATLVPEEVIVGPFDALCRGEGEFPSLETLAQLGDQRLPSGIPNLWIRRLDGTIEKNETRPYMRDLDALPFPDLSMWESWFVRKPTTFTLLLGRGCPFACTYCSNHAFKGIAAGAYVRFRSPQSILRELKMRASEFPDISECYLEVETIAGDVSWLKELCRELAAFNAHRPQPFKFGCNYRVSRPALDEQVFEALASARVESIDIGLEAGSERIRKEVLNRFYTNDEFMRAVSQAKRRGMSIGLYNMLGIPGETHSDHLETARLNRLVQPDRHYTSIFYPYPGTQLHARCANANMIPTDHDGMHEREKAVIDQKGYPRWLVELDYLLFDFRVYRGRRPGLSLLCGLLSRILCRMKVVRSLLRRVIRRA